MEAQCSSGPFVAESMQRSALDHFDDKEDWTAHHPRYVVNLLGWLTLF
jgi:hypothetical protein